MKGDCPKCQAQQAIGRISIRQLKQKGKKGKSGVFGAWVLKKTSAQKKAFGLRIS